MSRYGIGWEDAITKPRPRNDVVKDPHLLRDNCSLYTLVKNRLVKLYTHKTFCWNTRDQEGCTQSRSLNYILPDPAAAVPETACRSFVGYADERGWSIDHV